MSLRYIAVHNLANRPGNAKRSLGQQCRQAMIALSGIACNSVRREGHRGKAAQSAACSATEWAPQLPSAQLDAALCPLQLPVIRLSEAGQAAQSTLGRSLSVPSHGHSAVDADALAGDVGSGCRQRTITKARPHMPSSARAQLTSGCGLSSRKRSGALAAATRSDSWHASFPSYPGCSGVTQTCQSTIRCIPHLPHSLQVNSQGSKAR